MNFDLMHLWSTMGLINKGVAVCLVVMSLLSILITIERVMVYSRATGQSLRLAEKLGGLLAEHKLEEAIETAGRAEYKTSYLGPIVAQGLNAFMTRRKARSGDAVDAARRSIEKCIQLEDLGMKRGISILATIASTSPFVGLFGTVFGIINAFKGMGESGSAGIGAVSAGIAEALIATGFGLFVAIPATWAFNYFLSRIEAMNTEMHVSTTELIDYCVSQQESGAA